MTIIEKLLVGCGLIVAIAFGIHTPDTTVQLPDTDRVGGQNGGFQTFPDGIGYLGNIHTTPGAALGHYSGTLDPGSEEEKIFRNTTGKDVFVDYANINVITGETASSSFKVYLFATTSSSIDTWADFGTLAEGKRAIINGTTLATSTTATTTSSVYAASAGEGNGSVLVPNNSYLHLFLQRGDSNCPTSGAGACEAATSTNRGFNPTYNVRVHY